MSKILIIEDEAAIRRVLTKILSEENDILIRTFLIEKAIYELGYELNGRPDWTMVPLRGIDYLVKRYVKEKEEKRK